MTTSATLDARAIPVLAWLDELRERPELLRSWCGAFSDADETTLAVLVPPDPAALEWLVGELDRSGSSADVLAVPLDGPLAEAAAVAAVTAVLTQRDDAIRLGLPVIGADTSRDALRAALPSGADPALAEARRIGDDWRHHDYYAEVEQYMDQAWDVNVWPIISGCDFSNVVDLACGHGRNTRKLLEVADRVTVADINVENIDHCRERFGDDPRVEYLVNDGVSLAGLPEASVSLVYCYDAMVHFDSDSVRSYLRDFTRVLRPGGHAFCHHSNYTGNPGGDVHDNPQWRNFMSKELFAHYAGKAGLQVITSRVIDWSVDAQLDCLTLVRRPRS